MASLCLAVACALLGVLATATTAKAGYYRMVLCAGNVGSSTFTTATNTVSGANPGGIFNFENACGPAPFPAGSNAWLRIAENQSAGNAGTGAYGRMTWASPTSVSIAAFGGYTRQPAAFNEGWRTRLWGEGFDGTVNDVLVQGAGVANGSCGGVCWATTSTFASHLWPFGTYSGYRHFTYEMLCVRAAGCDRSGANVSDANTLVLTLNDLSPASVNLFTSGSRFLAGAWSRGVQNVGWVVSDSGSGMRYDNLKVDGVERFAEDWRAHCNLDAHGAVGEYARDFAPCPQGGPWGHDRALDTASLTDGAHTVSACAQDYGQAAGVSGSGGWSCDERTVHVDNTAPGAPVDLTVETPSPARYSDRFGAHWSLPADGGSPITKVHFEIVDAAGEVVVAEQTVEATDPTELEGVVGPKAAGDYRLRVWLEDAVGLLGSVASVPIPHDTTPPAAPQEISVASPDTPRSSQGFDVRWRNITDAGSPIDAVHYQVLNGAGKAIVGTKDVAGENVQSIADLDAPREIGGYTLKLWLSDAEGNVGAPASIPLSYECVRSAVQGGQSLSAGLGKGQDAELVVPQGEDSFVSGALHGPSSPVPGAAVCVFSRVITDEKRSFLGVAVTGADGDYRFGLDTGPSREITTVYRPDHRQVGARVKLQTRVKPTLKIRKRVVRNKHAAVFSGEIPGPSNDKVVVVLQVKSGKGWRAFRRYRTRGNGRFQVRYRFTQTRTPTKYLMRAQVRETTGYPYLQGSSKAIPVRVLP